MIPFACISLQSKKNKDQLNKRKRMKTDKKKKFFGGLKGPLVRGPYWPPDPLIKPRSVWKHQHTRNINTHEFQHTRI